jgi:hypothetical protein
MKCGVTFLFRCTQTGAQGVFLVQRFLPLHIKVHILKHETKNGEQVAKKLALQVARACCALFAAAKVGAHSAFCSGSVKPLSNNESKRSCSCSRLFLPFIILLALCAGVLYILLTFAVEFKKD